MTQGSRMNKKELSETDICDLFITPAIKDAAGIQLTQIRREVTLTPGPVVVRGNMSSRNKKKKKFADYVLLSGSRRSHRRRRSQGQQPHRQPRHAAGLGLCRHSGSAQRIQFQRRCLRLPQQSAQPQARISRREFPLESFPVARRTLASATRPIAALKTTKKSWSLSPIT